MSPAPLPTTIPGPPVITPPGTNTIQPFRRTGGGVSVPQPVKRLPQTRTPSRVPDNPVPKRVPTGMPPSTISFMEPELAAELGFIEPPMPAEEREPRVTPLPPPFKGGQCSGISYRLKGINTATGYSVSFGSMTGPIVTARVQNFQEVYGYFQARARAIVINHSDTFNASQFSSLLYPAESSYVELTRADGLPDTCGDPPSPGVEEKPPLGWGNEPLPDWPISGMPTIPAPETIPDSLPEEFQPFQPFIDPDSVPEIVPFKRPGRPPDPEEPEAPPSPPDPPETPEEPPSEPEQPDPPPTWDPEPPTTPTSPPFEDPNKTPEPDKPTLPGLPDPFEPLWDPDFTPEFPEWEPDKPFEPIETPGPPEWDPPPELDPPPGEQEIPELDPPPGEQEIPELDPPPGEQEVPGRHAPPGKEIDPGGGNSTDRTRRRFLPPGGGDQWERDRQQQQEQERQEEQERQQENDTPNKPPPFRPPVPPIGNPDPPDFPNWVRQREEQQGQRQEQDKAPSPPPVQTPGGGTITYSPPEPPPPDPCELPLQEDEERIVIKWVSVQVPKVQAVNTAGVWTSVRTIQTVRVIATDNGNEIEKTRAEFEMRATTAEAAIAARNSSGINTGLITTNIANVTNVMNFMKKAWEATRLQKVLDIITTIAVLHNAAMLSRDVAETFGHVASQALQIVGIKDEEGNPLDVNSFVGDIITDAARNLLGEEVYNDLRESYKKANRIIQIGSSIVWTVRSIADAGLELQEWIGENTGRIGNALKKYGVVGENAYRWMSPNPRARNRIRDRFQRFYDGIEAADDTVSSYAQVTGNILEIGEEVNEFRDQKDRFIEEVTTGLPQDQVENTPVATEEATAKDASLAPDIPVNDAQQG
jgi:hypothetical protein